MSPQPETDRITETSTAGAPDTATSRRARGIALIVGAVVTLVLVGTDTLAYYWFPLLTGLTYLAAAVAGRSRGTLWAPGLMISIVGLSTALWLRDGNSPDSFQFLALAIMSLGLGGVIAALLEQYAGLVISAMSVAMATLLFGAFLLAEQQGIKPFAGEVWPFALLLAVWGAYELRPRKS